MFQGLGYGATLSFKRVREGGRERERERVGGGLGFQGFGFQDLGLGFHGIGSGFRVPVFRLSREACKLCKTGARNHLKYWHVTHLNPKLDLMGSSTTPLYATLPRFPLVL